MKKKKNIKYAEINYTDYNNNAAIDSVANIEENTAEGLLLKSLAPVPSGQN
jgi:hypothetical protein